MRTLLLALLLHTLLACLALADGIRDETQVDELISPDGATESTEPHLAATAERVFAVWQEEGDTSDVFLAISFDGGKSFDAPQWIDLDAEDDDVNPRVAADGDLVVIVWLKGDPQDVFGVVSNDGGLTFSSELELSGPLEDDLGDADFLRVAVAGAQIHVFFEDDVASPGFTEDLYAVSSSDSGATFGDPVRVNDFLSGSADVDDPAAACDGTSAYVAWIDDRGGHDEVYFSSSSDGGFTWAANTRLDSALDPTDADSPQLVLGAGGLHVAWLDDRAVPGEEQPYHCASFDFGASFSADQRVGQTPDDVDADDIQIAASEDAVYIVYADVRGAGDRDNLFVAVSEDGVTFEEVEVAVNDGLIAANAPRVVAFGSTVAISYFEETFEDGLDQPWLAYSSDFGDEDSWSWHRLAEELPEESDADSNQLAATGQQDLVALWTDDRAGDDNEANDLYSSGQRLPNLFVETTGNKTSFRIADVDDADDGLFFLAAISATGDDYLQLRSGFGVCLTPDATTYLLLQPWALGIVGADIDDGTASTIPFRFPFEGYAVGLVLDFADPDIVLRATDPVEF